MALVELTIGKRQLQLSCSDGEEQKLIELARQVDERITKITKSLSTGNDKMVLIMTAITMQDEINELKNGKNNTVLEGEVIPPIRPEKLIPQTNINEIFNNQELKAAIEEVEAIADYLENIAEKIEAS